MTLLTFWLTGHGWQGWPVSLACTIDAMNLVARSCEGQPVSWAEAGCAGHAKGSLLWKLVETPRATCIDGSWW